MSKVELISVIIPTTPERRKETLRLVASVEENCPVASDVVIVVQGGEEEAEFYRKEYTTHTNVRVLYNERRHAARARNLGLEAARGDMILLADSDCEYTREFFTPLPSGPDIHVGIWYALDSTQRVGKVSREGLLSCMDLFLINMMCCFFPHESIKSVRFEESIVFGTRYGAGEDLDFLIRVKLRNPGQRYVMDPWRKVLHPVVSFETTPDKFLSRGRGQGFIYMKIFNEAVQKRDYSLAISTLLYTASGLAYQIFKAICYRDLRFLRVLWDRIDGCLHFWKIQFNKAGQ